MTARAFNPEAADSADFIEFMRLAGGGQAEMGGLIRDYIDFGSTA